LRVGTRQRNVQAQTALEAFLRGVGDQTTVASEAFLRGTTSFRTAGQRRPFRTDDELVHRMRGAKKAVEKIPRKIRRRIQRAKPLTSEGHGTRG
jgi:hypothetical protein